MIAIVTESREQHWSARFELVQELGRGAMGIVYEAFDREQDKRVALKTIRDPEPEKILRLKREFRALRDLRHRNLVQLGELIEENGRWLFTMELVQGNSFLEYVWRSPPVWVERSSRDQSDSGSHSDASDTTALTVDLPLGSSPVRFRREVAESPVVDEDRLRHALRELASGLVALHRAGKVHRDIKPSNILVSDRDRVVLVDFGVVAELVAERGAGRIIGTPAYMAPEQVERKALSPAADWYGVGAVLFEALTGRPPFTARTRVELFELKLQNPVPPPSEIVGPVPTDLDQLCHALLSRSPDARPGEAAILAALGAAPAEILSDKPRRGEIFVGRSAELAVLATAWRRVTEGQAAAVSIEGPSGIGKTALADEFAARVGATRGALVLRGRCHAHERIPYNGLDGIIDQLATHLGERKPPTGLTLDRAGDLLRVFPSLRVVPWLAERAARSRWGTGIEIRAQAFSALRRLLDRVAATAPVLCLLDDLQWADADSQAAIQELTQGDDAPPILWIATIRTNLPSSPDPSTDALQIADRRRLELGGLSTSDATSLAVELGSDAELAATVASETAGHPLFIEELVHGVVRGAGVRLDDALYQRARELPGHALRVLRAVAVADRPIPREVIREVAELGAAGFDRAVEALAEARLVRVHGVSPADLMECFHDRVREVVYERIEDERRRQLHASLAELLRQRGAAAEELFDHYRCAGENHRALDCAEAAASRAHSSLAFARAAEIYLSALGLGVADPERRLDLWINLAQALENDDHPRDAAEAYLRAAGLAADDEAAELKRRAGRQLLVGGYVRDGMTLMTDAAARAGISLPTRKTRIFAGLLLGQLRLNANSLRFEPRPEQDIPSAELAPIDVCWGLGGGLYMVDIPLGAYYTTRGALLALRAGEPSRIARALAAASLGAGAMGRHDRAREMIAAAKRAAQESDSQIARFYARMAEVLAYFTIDNDLAGCLDALPEALDEWGRCGRGPGWETDNIDHFWASCLLGTFRGSRFVRRVGARIRAARRSGNRFSELTFRVRFMGPALLWHDRPDQAWDDVSEALAQWRVEREEFGNQRLWALWSLTQIAAYAGDTEKRADQLLAEWKRAERSLINRVALMRMMSMLHFGGFWLSRAQLAQARGAPDEAERYRRRALHCARQADRNPQRLAKPIAAYLRATVAHQRGDQEQARAIFERAYSWSEKVGPDGISMCIQHRLGQLRGDSRGEGLRGEVEQWLRRHGAVDPDRWIEGWVPGW